MRTKVAALAAAAAVLGSVAISTGPANAAAGDPPFAGVTISMSPANGASGTVFGMNFTSTATGLPVAAACPGDNPGGWFWTAFIVPAGTDIGALTFGASGSPLPPAVLPPGQTIAQFRPLATPTGTFLRAQAPGLGDGLITSPAGLWLGNNPLPAGAYQVGVACYQDSTLPVPNLTGRYFSTPITVTSSAVVPVTNPQGYNYAFGAVPAAPVLEAGAGVAVTATTAVVDFTQAAAVPPVTGFTASVTPSAGVTIAPLTAASTSISLSGLTTGTPYTVTLTSANATGTSPVSNSTTFTPLAAQQPAITPTFTPGVGQGTVNIPAVALGTPASRTALPTGYTLNVSPAPSGANPASFTIPFVAGPITQVVDGLTAGTPYTFSLVPTYAPPNGGPTTTVTGASNNAQVIQQRITVVRPVGQLILTQRCGVNGALAALPADAGFPGFPTALPAVPASADQAGTTPDITPNGVFPTGAGSLADAVTPDPQFNNYPFPSPATYPTECGVNLGTATIVSSGPLAGQYYQANGFINEVTVSDLRDTDLGWEVRGQMSDFVGTVSSTNTIDGDYLGWNPVIQNTTPTTATGYTQTVAAGPGVLPGTGVVGAAPGLGSGRRLAIATENLGLGVAQMDARLRLLIPIASNNDTYTGILNFTVLDNDNGPL